MVKLLVTAKKSGRVYLMVKLSFVTLTRTLSGIQWGYKLGYSALSGICE